MKRLVTYPWVRVILLCVCLCECDLHCSLWHTQQKDRETAVSRSSQKLAANVGNIKEQQDIRHFPCRNKSWSSSLLSYTVSNHTGTTSTPYKRDITYDGQMGLFLMGWWYPEEVHWGNHTESKYTDCVSHLCVHIKRIIPVYLNLVLFPINVTSVALWVVITFHLPPLLLRYRETRTHTTQWYWGYCHKPPKTSQITKKHESFPILVSESESKQKCR